MPCSSDSLETEWMVLKHPGGTPLAEKGLASAEPVLALPGGLCGRGSVEDGFCGVMLLSKSLTMYELEKGKASGHGHSL